MKRVPMEVDATPARTATPPRGTPATDNGETRDTDLTIGILRILGGVLLALGGGVLLVFLIGRQTGFSDLETVLREGDWRWLAVCAGGQIAVFTGYSGVFRTALSFEGGPHVPARLSLRVVLTSFAMTQLVAAGGAAGLAVTYWALRKLGLARRAAVVRLLGINTIVYLVFAALAFAAALLAFLTAAAPVGATLPWIALLPVFAFLAWWFTEPQRVQRWATPSGGALRRALSTGVGAAWFARRVTSTHEGRPMLGWALLYWVADVGSLWGALHAFGDSPSLAALALVYVIGYLAAAVPIPFIATGGIDAALTFALQMVGVPLDLALVSVVAHRVFAFWIPMMPGIVLGFLLGRTGAALEAARDEHEREHAVAG